jgi:HEAT repeat protein
MIFRYLIDPLMDEESAVRLEAARAIATMDGEEAALMLRVKARTGDKDSRVIGQVFDCLLEVEREGGLPFLGEFLRGHSEELQAEAALSAGSSRMPGAVDLLLDELPRARAQSVRNVILRGLSASRQPRAVEFLLTLLKGSETGDALGAMNALAMHRDSPAIRAQVEAVVRDTGAETQARFWEKFGR